MNITASLKKIIVAGNAANISVFEKYAIDRSFEILGYLDYGIDAGDFSDSPVVSIKDLKNIDYDELFIIHASTAITLKLLFLLRVNGIKKPVRDIGYVNREYMWHGIENKRFAVLTEISDFAEVAVKDLEGVEDVGVYRVLQGAFCKGNHSKPSNIKTIVVVRSLAYCRVVEKQLNDFYNCKKVFLLSDMMGGSGYLKRGKIFAPERLKKVFDRVYTYHLGDAEKYGFTAAVQPYCKKELPEAPETTDIFFVGRAKDRLDMLHEAYEKFVDAGFKCAFWIKNVPEEKRLKDADGIVYGKGLKYDEYLEHMNESKCIFEVCNPGNETTMRFAESVVYGKILITNDIKCKNRQFYDDKHMYTFSCVEDIDTDGIWSMIDYRHRNESKPVYNGEFSPIEFLKVLKTDLNDECNEVG